ncbi:unnamed protein product [Dovyalis caffra]|uniref:rRNA N-glycosylase n=1 Tax=Dovyalis caffra TaxID=77055 RepID=A0AAV1SLQ1_9ROSI|nr:unnamed protein product [Dovyalis caffra]
MLKALLQVITWIWWLLQITTWVWWIVIIVPALLWPSVKQETQTLRYKTITFNFEGATPASYSAFVNSLRNEVESKKVFGLPVTATTAKVCERYILVDLKFKRKEEFLTLTLAIDVIDLYVVGYRDKYDEKDRANFLKDAPKVARDNLFEEAQKAKQVRDTTFKGTYTDLERFAGDRQIVELGVFKLQQAILSVYGKPDKKKKDEPNIEAKFFIISIQMVSEAARFQYIRKKVLEGGIYGSYKPDPKAISLETSWDKISKAIQTADASGKFRSEIILKDEKGNTWIVKKVSDIKNDMGLLKGQASKFSQLMQMAYI